MVNDQTILNNNFKQHEERALADTSLPSNCIHFIERLETNLANTVVGLDKQGLSSP